VHNTPSEQARHRDRVLEALADADAKNDGKDRVSPIGSVIICDIDLPLFILNGVVYLQAPLEDVVDAFTAQISDLLSNLEGRISEARSAALSLASLQPTLLGEELALRILVSGGRE
jgi:hypothetical protein